MSFSCVSSVIFLAFWIAILISRARHPLLCCLFFLRFRNDQRELVLILFNKRLSQTTRSWVGCNIICCQGRNKRIVQCQIRNVWRIWSWITQISTHNVLILRRWSNHLLMQQYAVLKICLSRSVGGNFLFHRQNFISRGSTNYCTYFAELFLLLLWVSSHFINIRM